MKSVHLSSMRSIAFIILVATVATMLPAHATVWYVSPDGIGSGTSWAETGALQATVNAAAMYDEVWVKAGTYTATTDPILTMKDGVSLYGGFAGTETAREQRDWNTNLTVIDGESTRRCIYSYRVDNLTLDGFILKNGFALSSRSGGMYNYLSSPVVSNCTFTKNSGPGMRNSQSSPVVSNCTFTENDTSGMYNSSSSPVVSNCTFTDNSGSGMRNLSSSPTVTNCTFMENIAKYGGGGMYNSGSYNSPSSPTVTNCTFTLNTAGSSGGGMFNYGPSSPTVTNCTFTGNRAAYDDYGGGMANISSSTIISNCIFMENTAYGGGGMVNSNCSPLVTNCTFTGNSAVDGGGMFNYDSSPIVTNCTFTGNRAGDGGSMFNDDSSPIVTNCILWENHAPSEIGGSEAIISYSCVEGGYAGIGNIDSDPLFVNPFYSLQLLSDSPCIDSGTFDGAPDSDILGNTRPVGTGIDMGAYEGGILPEDTVTLTITTFPSGVGQTVPPEGVYRYIRGDVALFSAYGMGGIFSHWEGDASGNYPSTTILMDDNKTATAIFMENIYRVGVGSMASEPDGRSWESAYSDIQSAVDAAFSAGAGEVWVAAGTYTATTDPVVIMKGGVCLYGGFAGTETERDQRNSNTNVTIINGESVRRCVYSDGVDNTILDGFTITNGYSRIGGGMCNSSSSPTVTNCIFMENSASYGGGMCNSSSSPTVTNCIFMENSAYAGGGMYNSYSSPSVTNCTFTLNITSEGGCGMYNFLLSSPRVINCIFWDYNAVSEIDGTAATVSYSCVQGGYAGTGNIDSDPLFVNTFYSLQLLSGSPCIDSGTFDGAPDIDILA